MRLEEGDLILTGTPSGVGPVKSGQTIHAGITGITEFTFQVINRQFKNSNWKKHTQKKAAARINSILSIQFNSTGTSLNFKKGSKD